MSGPIGAMTPRGDQDAVLARGAGEVAPPPPSFFHFDWDATKASAAQAVNDVPGREAALRNGELLVAAGELARLRGGKLSDYYLPSMGEPHGLPQIDEDVFWRDVSAVRRQRPDALKDLGAGRVDWDKRRMARLAGERAERGAAMAQGGLAGNLLGGAVGAFTDPINILTLPLGGGGRTVAMKMLSAGGWNAAIEAVEQPLLGAERVQQGGELTLGEAAMNIGGAFVGGAGLQGVGSALGKTLEAGATGAGKFYDRAAPFDWRAAQALKKDLGGADWLMTPDQAAAIHVIERGAEVDATSPFPETYAGLNQHVARLERAMADLGELPRPSGDVQLAARAPAVAAPSAAPSVRAQALSSSASIDSYMAKTRRAESSGDDRAVPRDPKTGRLLSSAGGRYQFTNGTWLATYKARYGAGTSDAAILARKFDPALQEQLMRDLTAGNAAALRRAGVPVTEGNLYLAHFAGEAGARKLHAAAPGTPVEAVLGARAVAANPFLRGKSAAETIAWADRKMGGAGAVDVPPARADLPEEVAVRDPALDEARPDAFLPELARDRFADDASWRIAQAEHDAELLGALPAESRQSIWAEARDRLLEDKRGEAKGVLFHDEIGPIDVKWGDDKRGLAHIVRDHDEVLEDLPALLADMEVVSRDAKRVHLESFDHAAAVRLDYDGKAQRWLLTAFQREEPKLRESAAPSSGVSMRAEESAGASPTAGAMRDIALEAQGIKLGDGVGDFARMWDRQIGDARGLRPVHAIVDRDGVVRRWELTHDRAARQMARMGIKGEVRELVPDIEGARVASPAARDELEAAGAAGPVIADPATGRAFDDAGGEGARSATDSMWHDLRAQAALHEAVMPEQLSFDLDDGRGPRTIQEIDDELTQFEQGIAAIKGCLK